jgi:hypothetical protein
MSRLDTEIGVLMHAHADSAVCSGCSRPSSGRAQACSPSDQVKAAAAHVQILKRNQREKKLYLAYLEVSLSSISHVMSNRNILSIHCYVAA